MSCSEFQLWIEASFGGDIDGELPKELDADFTTAAEEELDKLFGF